MTGRQLIKEHDVPAIQVPGRDGRPFGSRPRVSPRETLGPSRERGLQGWIPA